jgi:tRNA pseudouridine38-40 synthase
MDDGPEAAEQMPLWGVCLKVAYDGSDFSGFQRQPGQRTVQGELERAAPVMTGHAVRMRGAGRTDAGVHARGQVVAFASARNIPPQSFMRGLNQLLPDDIRVQAAWSVAPGYDPRFDSTGKIYRYLLQLGEVQDPLLRLRTWQLAKVQTLDVPTMRRAARALEGTHDYRAFRSADDTRENTVRTLWSIDVRTPYLDDARLVCIDVHGNAFMKNMVRILVGTLVGVGRGRISLARVAALLGPQARREDAGQTVPPHGLTLEEVFLGREAPAGGPFP